MFIHDKYLDEDALSFQFDLKADISDLFNWNTNIIFFSVICEYSTEYSDKNQVVVWD